MHLRWAVFLDDRISDTGFARLPILSAMRRRLILLLVLILPLQFSWAAVGIACMHETGSGAAHFGHHVHQHKAETKATPKDGKADTNKSIADVDCPFCHMSAPTPVAEFHVFDSPQAESSKLPEPLPLHDVAFEEAPERPNW